MRIIRDMRNASFAAARIAAITLIFALTLQACNDATKRPAGAVPAAMGIRG